MRDGGKSFYPWLKEYLPESFADCLHNTFRVRAGLKPLPSPVGLTIVSAGLFNDAAQATLREAGRVITLNSGASISEHKRLAEDDHEERLVKRVKIEDDVEDDNVSISQSNYQEASDELEKLRTAVEEGEKAKDMLKKEQLATAKLKEEQSEACQHMF